MHDPKARRRRRTGQVIGAIILIAVFTAAIWVDLATGLWQQAVILSGIAAGLLTFLLTALFFERWMAGADHRRWYPVTRLALTDVLHALGDEDSSQLSRGLVVPHTLNASDEHVHLLDEIHRLRRLITHALARWSGFLAASADVQGLMDHIAELALLLDGARDAALDAERDPADPAARAALRHQVGAVNASIRNAVDEIERALSPTGRNPQPARIAARTG